MGLINNNIFVIDSIMGSGKTSATINYVKELPETQKVMIIVLYDTEVKRIIDACKDRNFQEPIFKDGRKLYGLRELLRSGANIVSTHALFSRFEEEEIRMVKEQGYICFIDETIDCLSNYVDSDDKAILNPYDVEVLMDKYVTIKEDGELIWKVEDYGLGRFYEEKRLIDNHRLTYDNGKLMLIFPISILLAFKEVYILTYLFKGSVMYCYLQQHMIDFSYLYIEGTNKNNFMITDSQTNLSKPNINYRELINVLDNPKMNEIGDGKTDLSLSWYTNRATDGDMRRLCLNMDNCFRNIWKEKVTRCMWTTFVSQKDRILSHSRGLYKKGFVPINKRASNSYVNCSSVSYLVNRYMNVNVSSYFKGSGITPDQNLFALSEMLQFIYRSSIRKGESINVYVPSARMRGLLNTWIDENSN